MDQVGALSNMKMIDLNTMQKDYFAKVDESMSQTEELKKEIKKTIKKESEKLSKLIIVSVFVILIAIFILAFCIMHHLNSKKGKANVKAYRPKRKNIPRIKEVKVDAIEDKSKERALVIRD